MSKMSLKKIHKSVLSILLSGVATITLLTSDVQASGVNYSHYVTCDCCYDTVWVSERLEVNSYWDVKSSFTINEGTINRSTHTIYVAGRVNGNVVDQNTPQRGKGKTNVTAGTYVYDWSSELDLWVEKVKMEFMIQKGNSTDTRTSLWQYPG